MICFVQIEKVYLNLIMTDSDNIDWNDKSIIDVSKLKDIKIKREQQVMVVDRQINEVKTILVKDIDLKSHQIVLGAKRWIPLHIID